MKKIFILLYLFLFITQAVEAQQQIISYTVSDRDRSVRMETKMNEEFTRLETKMDSEFNRLDTKMNVEFNSLQKQIDQLYSIFYWGFGILISLFLFNLGYTIWDRRTAIKPALDKAESADLKSTGMMRILRDYAKDHPDLADILKIHGFL